MASDLAPNSAMESFFSLLRAERTARKVRRSREQARDDVFDYIEQKAAEAVGVSQPVGTRWFRHRGGMPLFMSKPVSARYLSFRGARRDCPSAGQGARDTRDSSSFGAKPLNRLSRVEPQRCDSRWQA